MISAKDPMTTPTESYGPRGGPVQLFFLKNGTPRRPMVDRGEGIYLWDTQGRRYIDASSGPIAANIGHANARVIEASDRQMRKVAYASRVFLRTTPILRWPTLLPAWPGLGWNALFSSPAGLRPTRVR